MKYKPAKRSKKGHQHRSLIKAVEYFDLDDHQFFKDDLDDTIYDDNDGEWASNYAVYLDNYISQSLTRHLNNSSNKKVSTDCNVSFQDVYHCDKEIKKSPCTMQESSMNNFDEPKPTHNVLIIEDDHLVEKHKRTHDLLKKRNVMLETILSDFCPHCRCFSQRRIDRLRSKRAELSTFEKEIQENDHTESHSRPKELVEPSIEVSAINRSCRVKLASYNIAISELQRILGKKLPRRRELPKKVCHQLVLPYKQ